MQSARPKILNKTHYSKATYCMSYLNEHLDTHIQYQPKHYQQTIPIQPITHLSSRLTDKQAFTIQFYSQVFGQFEIIL